MNRQLFLTFIALLFCVSLAGQCPARDFLWKRIVYLRDSSKISPSDQLNELKGYLEKMNNCPFQNDSTHALLLLRIGWLEAILDQINEAIRYTNLSIAMIHRFSGRKNINEAHLIKCYNNLSYLYDSIGNHILSRSASDSCIAISLRLKTGFDYSFSHIESKVEYLFAIGDFYNCLYYSDLGEYVLKQTNYSPDSRFFLYAWKINALIFLKKFTEADSLVDQSIEEIKHSPVRNDLGTFYGLKALLEAEWGNQKLAIDATEKSILYNRKSGNARASAGALNNLGYNLYFKKLNQHDQAFGLYQKALLFADNNDSISIYTNMANVEVAKTNFSQGDRYFQNAFDVIYKGTSENKLASLPAESILTSWNGEYILTLILDKAESFIRRFKSHALKSDIDSAIRIYKSADRFLNNIKLSQEDFSSKLFWRNNTRRLYEHAIESAKLSGDMSSEFYFFEKSRAVLLNDQIKEQQTGDPALEEITETKKRISDISGHMSLMNRDSNSYAGLQRSLFLEKENLNKLGILIRQRNPWYFQSLLDTNIISLHEVQSNLMTNHQINVIIEFFTGDSTVYILFIEKGSSEVHEINKTQWDAVTTKYSEWLANPDKENKNYNEFLRVSKNLYDLIFKDAPAPTGRVIISPDGKYFPFESLIINESAEYFLLNHIVSYTYSVRFLTNEFERTQLNHKTGFMGMAPIQFPQNTGLASLVNSDVSLKNINSQLSNSKLFVGPSASKQNFINEFSKYEIIQLYTHASDQSTRGEPVIYFADSALYLSEIPVGQNIDTRLIVLSACETGNGNLYQGEGVFSFNRNFAAVGIPSAMINLWSVDNEATYQLTELFYKYVSKGLELDVALQKAKIDFIKKSSKEKKLPYYWASSILVGRTNAILIEKPGFWKWIIYSLTGLIIIFILKSWNNRFIWPFKIVRSTSS